MAVIIEAISVVIKESSIIERFNGGLDSFKYSIPNATHCKDGLIHKISFLIPSNAKEYVFSLQSKGLFFVNNGEYVDIAIVDMLKGITAKCSWLNFKRDKYFTNTSYKNSGNDFSIAWLKKNETDNLLPANEDGSISISVPPKWDSDHSLSADNFIKDSEMNKRWIVLEIIGNKAKILDTKTGKISYCAKSEIKNPSKN